MTLAVSLIGFLILIVSIIAHELAHGYAADSLGDPTARLAGRLTLNPLAHVDLFGSIIVPLLLVFSSAPVFFGWAKPVPYNPYNLRHGRFGEAAVALAGVTTNLALAVFFALVVRFGALAGLNAAALLVAATIAYVNLFLGLFNLIPFPPLDGFTALRALLPWSASRKLHAFEHQIRAGGMMGLILFLILFSFVLAGPFSALVQFLFRMLAG